MSSVSYNVNVNACYASGSTQKTINHTGTLTYTLSKSGATAYLSASISGQYNNVYGPRGHVLRVKIGSSQADGGCGYGEWNSSGGYYSESCGTTTASVSVGYPSGSVSWSIELISYAEDSGLYARTSSGEVATLASGTYNHSTTGYYLDLNGNLNGTDSGNLGNYGTAVVKINDAVDSSGNGVTDFYKIIAPNSTYSITVTPKSGYALASGQAATVSGTITAATSVRFSLVSLATLDLNGTLDGTNTGNVSGYGTATVKINNTTVSSNVTDFCQSEPYGTTYSITVTPTTGHSLASGQSATISGTMGTSAVDARFKLITNTHTLILNHNGGTFNDARSSSYTVKYGSSNYYSCSGRIPKYENHVFLGWYTATSGGTKIYDSSGKCVTGTSYWDSSSKWCYTGANNTSVTLYAQWDEITAPVLSGVNLIDKGLSYARIGWTTTINNSYSTWSYSEYILTCPDSVLASETTLASDSLLVDGSEWIRTDSKNRIIANKLTKNTNYTIYVRAYNNYNMVSNIISLSFTTKNAINAYVYTNGGWKWGEMMVYHNNKWCKVEDFKQY